MPRDDERFGKDMVTGEDAESRLPMPRHGHCQVIVWLRFGARDAGM